MPRAINRVAGKKSAAKNKGKCDAPSILARGQKRKVKKEEPAADNDVPVKKTKEDPKSKPSTSTKPKEETEIKKLKFSGAVPVDEHCELDGYHVYVDESINSPLRTFNAMLNQTNIGANNNKYYIIQLLQHDSKCEYATWLRWGRVGKIAGKKLQKFGANLKAAKDVFAGKFHDKTGNSWLRMAIMGVPFEKVKGKYDLLEMDYGENEEKQEKQSIKKDTKQKLKTVPSKLDHRVQEVIDLIFNIREFEACVKEMEFDVKKAPLGKLTSKQVKAGYETLKKIEKCIQEGDKGSALEDACSEFYTRIPHDFGMKKPPLITTFDQLKQKIQLLEALSDIQIAVQMISEDEKVKDEVNIKDRHYDSLGCKLEPFDTQDDEFKMVKRYVANSHGSTHGRYNLKVENVYKVEREGDSARFKDKIGNKMLLWHGSRLTNWCGILKQGLRIAPPEAPVTGYMFGKGVYFADMVSKSANYCFANDRQPNGFLLLCEVALGDTNEKVHGDYNANKLPKGKFSTKGMGREVPNPKGHKTMDCGTAVPLGKPNVPKTNKNFYLLYNEYIVYDVAQIRPRYLVKVKFEFNNSWYRIG